MQKRFLSSVALAAALGAIVTASAAAEPSTFAVARMGSLDVVSSINVTPRAVDLLGGWTNDALGCNEFRTIRVQGEIHYTSPSGVGKNLIKVRKSPMRNCAEGGPNLGFFLNAARNGFACPDGRWKPGRYDFVTRTRHLASGLVAIGTLAWVRSGSC